MRRARNPRIGFEALALTFAAQAFTVGCSGPASSGAGQNQIPQAAAESSPEARPRGQASYGRILRAAESALDSGHTERALELLGNAISDEPQRPEAYVMVGRAHAVANDLAGAAAAYETARKLGSTERRLFTELASVYDVMERYDDAIGVYQQWLAMTPNDAEMHHELGLTMLLLERFQDAADELSRAVAIAPVEPQTREDLGYALLRVGKIDAAASEFEAALKANPNLPSALRYLGQARAAQGRTDEALQLLTKAIEAQPQDTRALRVRARLLQMLGDATRALRDYRSVLEREPNDIACMLGAAGGLAALDKLDEADALLAKVRARQESTAGGSPSPATPEMEIRAAQVAWRRGQKAAVDVVYKAAVEQPKNLELWRDVEAAAKRYGNRAQLAEARKRLSTP